MFPLGKYSKYPVVKLLSFFLNIFLVCPNSATYIFLSVSRQRLSIYGHQYTGVRTHILLNAKRAHYLLSLTKNLIQFYFTNLKKKFNMFQTHFGNVGREDRNDGRLVDEKDQHAAGSVTSGDGNGTSAFSHNSGLELLFKNYNPIQYLFHNSK